MSDKKKMTAKWFLSLATRSGVKNAAAFISAHREWLENGELAAESAPILAKFDSVEVLPTPSLEELCKLAANHMLAQVEVEAAKPAREPRSEKPYTALIRDERGNIVLVKSKDGEKELRANFDKLQDAERWAHARLCETGSDWSSEVILNKTLTKENVPMVFKMTRAEAVKAAAPKKRFPFMHNRRPSGALSNTKVTVSPTIARFSRG